MLCVGSVPAVAAGVALLVVVAAALALLVVVAAALALLVMVLPDTPGNSLMPAAVTACRAPMPRPPQISTWAPLPVRKPASAPWPCPAVGHSSVPVITPFSTV